MEDHIQWDFGGFNPRFLGITQEFDSPEAYEAWQHYLSTDEPGVQSTQFGEMAVKSVLDHEVRHYHDALISPYGAEAFRARLMCLVNAVPALRRARDRPGNCVPCPVSRWASLNDHSRLACLAEWNSLPIAGRPWRPIEVPSVTRAQLAALEPSVLRTDNLTADAAFRVNMLAALRAYASLDALNSSTRQVDDVEFLSAHFFEIPALAVQIQSILQLRGLIGASKFMHFLLDSLLPYARLWQLYFKVGLILARRRHPGRPTSELVFATLPDIMAASTWCLLGSYELDGSAASPPERMETLASHLLATASEARALPSSTGALWDSWDEVTLTTPWRDSLRALLVYTKRGLRTLEQVVSSSGAEEISELALTLLDRYARHQREAVERLLGDPDEFALPHKYIDGAALYPKPLLRVKLNGFAVELHENPGVHWLSTLERDGRKFSRGFVVDPEAGTISEFVQKALLAERLMEVCDVVFSDFTVSSEAAVQARNQLETFCAKRPLRVVG
jgi:hypothetical protein